MRRNRALLLFLLGLLALAAITGWAIRQRLSQEQGLVLTLISPHGDNIRQEIGAAFQEWHALRYGARPQMQWLDLGGTSEALRYLEARYRQTPQTSGADVFFGGGTTPFLTLAKAGHLQSEALAPEVLADLPGHLNGQKLQDPAAGWYGICLSGFGMVFNRALLKQLGLPPPTRFSDLARPECLGKTAFIDPRGSGSAHVIYEIILQKYGWEKGFSLLARMAANAGSFTRGASNVLPLIANGEAAMAVAIDQYGWSLVESLGDQRIGFVLPQGETLLTPDPAALLTGAPQPELGRHFLAFLLSPQAQRLWVLKPGHPQGPQKQGLHRLAVRPEAYAGLTPETSLLPGNPFRDTGEAPDWVYSDSLTTARWTLLGDLLGLYLVDVHDLAQRIWKAALAGRNAHTANWEHGPQHALFQAPAPWDSLSSLLPFWKDAAFRNAKIAEWEKRLHLAPAAFEPRSQP